MTSAAISVAGAGDVNGDGFADLIVGAFGADPNGGNSGATYVVFGKASGFASSLELSALDGSDGFRINGEAASDISGRSVASAGDVNGDGFADLIIGAYAADPDGSCSGACYVVFGKASGFASSLELSALDGTNGFQINGEAAGDFSGDSVAERRRCQRRRLCRPDLRGQCADPKATRAAPRYVVFGKASGFASSLELSALDGSDGFQINGEVASDFSGCSVASAGDVNGDGFADLIIGAYGADPNGSFQRRLAMWCSARQSGLPPASSFPPSTASNGFQINGEAASDSSGCSVASAGDVNGDGFADLIVGANGADPNGTHSGASLCGVRQGIRLCLQPRLSALDGSAASRSTARQRVTSAAVRSPAPATSMATALPTSSSGPLRADPNGSASGASLCGVRQGLGLCLQPRALRPRRLATASRSTARQRVKSAASRSPVPAMSMATALPTSSSVPRAPPPTAAQSGASYVIYGSMPGEAVKRVGTHIANTIHGGDLADTLIGQGGDDTLIGHDGNDRLIGGAGGDVLDGGDTLLGADAGDDSLFGASGNDSLDGRGGNDRLVGGDNDDVLVGGAGNDTLNGGAGADMLTGGAGKDRLIGGAGADSFVFTDVSDSLPWGPNHDVIVGFVAGTDSIDLSAIDADGNSGNGDTAFSFAGGSFTGAGAEVIAVQTGTGNTIITGDLDGNTVPDFRIVLVGLHTLTDGDFVL